jgi:hypothetical protein
MFNNIMDDLKPAVLHHSLSDCIIDNCSSSGTLCHPVSPFVSCRISHKVLWLTERFGEDPCGSAMLTSLHRPNTIGVHPYLGRTLELQWGVALLSARYDMHSHGGVQNDYQGPLSMQAWVFVTPVTWSRFARGEITWDCQSFPELPEAVCPGLFAGALHHSYP